MVTLAISPLFPIILPRLITSICLAVVSSERVCRQGKMVYRQRHVCMSDGIPFPAFLSLSSLNSSPHRIKSVQATERMKIVDVLGAKQFSDGERIITQVSLLTFDLIQAEHYGCLPAMLRQGIWNLE